MASSPPRSDYRSVYQARNWGSTPMDMTPDDHDGSRYQPPPQQQQQQQHINDSNIKTSSSNFNGFLHLSGGNNSHAGYSPMLPPGLPLQLSKPTVATPYVRPALQHEQQQQQPPWASAPSQPLWQSSGDTAPPYIAAPPSRMLSHDTSALLSMLRAPSHDLFPSSQLSRQESLHESYRPVGPSSHQPLQSHQRRSSSPGHHSTHHQNTGPSTQAMAAPPQPQPLQQQQPSQQQPQQHAALQQGSEEGMRRAVQLQIILLMQKEQDKSQQGWLQELFDMTNASTMPVLCTLRRQLDVLLQPLPKAGSGSGASSATPSVPPAPLSVDRRSAGGPSLQLMHGAATSGNNFSHSLHVPSPRQLDTSGGGGLFSSSGPRFTDMPLRGGSGQLGGFGGPPGGLPNGPLAMTDTAVHFARAAALFANTGPPQPSFMAAAPGSSNLFSAHHHNSHHPPLLSSAPPFGAASAAGQVSLADIRSASFPLASGSHAPAPLHPSVFPAYEHMQNHHHHRELHRSHSHPMADAVSSFDIRGREDDASGGGVSGRGHPQLQQQALARAPPLAENRQRKNVFTMTIEEIVKKMQSGDLAVMSPDAILAAASNNKRPSTALERSVSADCSDRIISADKIQKVYDKPLKEAAKILSVSIMSLKRTCRKMGVSRWPYRKLASLSELEVTVRDDQLEQQLQPQDKEAVMLYIEAEKARIIVEPDRDVDPMLHNLRKAKIHMKYEKWGRKSLARANSNATGLEQEHELRSSSPEAE